MHTGAALHLVASNPAADALPGWAEFAGLWLHRAEWTASDLAALGLAMLPSTERRVREWLAREVGCPITNSGRGRGGNVVAWHRQAFPAALRSAIYTRLNAVMIALAGGPTKAAAVIPETDKLTRSQQQLARLSPKLAARAEARAEILDAWQAWRASTGRFGWKGQQAFCALYGAGEIAVSDTTRALVAACCAASLAAWNQKRDAGGLAALAGDYKAPEACIEAEPDLVATAEAAIAAFPHIRASHLRDILTTRCPDVAVPTLRSVQRWLASWKLKNRRTFASLSNPDAHRSKFRPAFGDAAIRINAPNDEWQSDASPADILLADGKRYALIGVIDVFTRRLRFHVAPTSTGHGIGLVLRRALIDFGVPRIFTTDNGADFTSRHIVRVLRDLEVTHKVTPPFSPERKPFIERAFRTFAHDLVELLPGYIGHDVAGRKAIEARRSFADRLMGKANVVELRMGASELQAFADQWCTARYEHRVHGTLKTTPALMAARHTGSIRRISDERALDILLAPVAGENGRRTVTKKGIRLENGTFIAAELGSLVGEVVECRADPADAGRIYVFDAEGGFVCVAVDPEREGVSREAIAQAAKAQAAAEIKARKAEIAAAGRGRINRDTIAREILNAQAAVSAADPSWSRHVVDKRVGAFDTYEKLARYMDEDIAVAVFGETLTTSAGDRGSQALGKVHDGVRLELIKADADLLSGTLNASLVRWLIEVNLPTAPVPTLWWSVEEPEDLNALATRDKTLADAGWTFTQERMEQVYGEGIIPKPKPEPPPSVPSAPGAAAPPAGTLDAAIFAEAKRAVARRRMPKAAPGRSTTDDLADQFASLTERIDDPLERALAALVDRAETLQEVADGLVALLPEISDGRLAELIAQALGVANLAGRSDLADGV